MNALSYCAHGVGDRRSTFASTARSATSDVLAALGRNLCRGVHRQVFLERSLRFFVDDAYIFLRYARQAVAGHGLVYNEAQHVLGFTSPLYVVVLAGAGVVGGPRGLVGEANLVDLLFYVVASAILVWLARRREASLPILMIAWLAWFPLVGAGVNGMETMLFILLQYGSLLLAVKGNEGWAFTVATLAALTRPEGAIFVVVLVGAALLHRRPTLRAWRSGVVGLLPSGPGRSTPLSPTTP